MPYKFNPFSGNLDLVVNAAEDISIVDAGDYYTGEDVETALQEIGDGTTLDGRYLKLDTSNDPLTGTLDMGENNIDNVGDITHDDATASDWIFRNEGLDKDIYINTNDGGVDTNNIFISGSDNFVKINRALQIESEGTASRVSLTPFGSFANLTARRRNGTIASPTAIVDNDVLMRFGGGGYNGTSVSGNSSQLDFTASEDWDATSQGTDMCFDVTPNGTTSRISAIFIQNDGDVGIGTTSPNSTLDVNGDTRLGDSTTNYMEVESDGDVNFVGGAGLQYGEIYAYEVGTTITISGSGVANKVQVTAFDTNGASNGSVTPDHTNDHITVGKAGHYLVTISMSMESTGGTAYILSAGLWKNNGASQYQNVHMSRRLSGGGSDTGSTSMSGIVDVAANDTLELWIWNETNTNNVIIDDVTLSVVQIGGT